MSSAERQSEEFDFPGNGFEQAGSYDPHGDLKQQVAARLAAHRSRRSRPTGPALVTAPEPGAVAKTSRSKTNSIAAAVAERYAQSQSYRDFLAAEAERAIKQANTSAIERAREAAREVQLLEEADHMPDGMDTIVGERGVQLSGGQKQRVALARALLSKPQVLLLDDPISAVDARTEVAILDAIERAAQNRTLLLITHRISAAARCDKILVMDDGRVVDMGTHDELAARPGLYARLAERQRLEAELEALQ